MAVHMERKYLYYKDRCARLEQELEFCKKKIAEMTNHFVKSPVPPCSSPAPSKLPQLRAQLAAQNSAVKRHLFEENQVDEGKKKQDKEMDEREEYDRPPPPAWLKAGTTVRGKKRQMLSGEACDKCSSYYAAAGLGKEAVQKCSRHRGDKPKGPPTPPGWYDPSWTSPKKESD